MDNLKNFYVEQKKEIKASIQSFDENANTNKAIECTSIVQTFDYRLYQINIYIHINIYL